MIKVTMTDSIPISRKAKLAWQQLQSNSVSLHGEDYIALTNDDNKLKAWKKKGGKKWLWVHRDFKKS